MLNILFFIQSNTPYPILPLSPSAEIASLVLRNRPRILAHGNFFTRMSKKKLLLKQLERLCHNNHNKNDILIEQVLTHAIKNLETTTTTTTAKRGRAFVVVAIATFLCAFLPIFYDSIEWLNFDDYTNFRDNEHVNSGFSFASSKWAFENGVVLGVYEPLSLHFKMLLFQFFSSAKCFIVTSVLIHLINTISVFLLSVNSFSNISTRTHVISTLFWAIHPLRVEVTAWASAQPYLLCTFCAIWSLYAQHKNMYWASLFMFTCSVLFKSASISLLFALAAWRVRTNKSLKWLVPHAIICFLLIMKTLSIKESAALLRELSVLDRIYRACFAVCFYFKSMIYPQNLRGRYPVPDIMSFNSIYGISFMFCCALGLICIYCIMFYHRVSSSLSRETAFHVLVFLFLLSPTLGLISNHVWGLAADRYVYMPSAIVFVPFLSLCLHKLCSVLCGSSSTRTRYIHRTTTYFHWTCFLILFTFSIQTFSQVRTWRNPRVFWKHMMDSDPSDAVPYNNYGNVLNRAGEFKESVRYYRKALSLNENYTEAWFNMANATLSDVILRTGGQGEDFKIDATKAVEMMVRGLRVEPDYPINFFSLANLFERIDRFDEAYDIYRQLSSNPDHSKRALMSMKRLSDVVSSRRDGSRPRRDGSRKSTTTTTTTKSSSSGSSSSSSSSSSDERRRTTKSIKNKNSETMIRAAEKLWKDQNNKIAAKRLLLRVLKKDPSNSRANQLMKKLMSNGDL